MDSSDLHVTFVGMKEQNGVLRAYFRCNKKPASFGPFLDRFVDDVDDVIMVLTHNGMRDEEKLDADFDVLIEPDCYDPEGTAKEFEGKVNQGVDELSKPEVIRYLIGSEDTGLVHSSRSNADNYDSY